MSADARAVAEAIIRNGLAVMLLTGFFAVIYFAARRFVGAAGRTMGRRAAAFATTNGVILAMLLLARKAVEPIIAGAAAPFSRLTSSDWPETSAIGVYRTLIATLAIILIIQAIGRLYWWMEERLSSGHTSRTGISAHVAVLVIASLRVLRYVSVLIVVALILPLILNQFPRTKPVVEQTAGLLRTPARDIGSAILGYLPNLGYVFVIFLLGSYALKGIRYFFNSIENGAIVVTGFLPEWSIPTYRLVRTLFLLFLLMVSYPYLPGSKSQFFQGFSVFVGALITFGSTATIGNIVSGTVLTYTRAFKIGDMVTIGDKTGVVIEKTLLVTRLLTPRNEEVSIPNGNVVALSIVNYSARTSDGLILTVTAGIGYDVDWRRVHRLMIKGARATKFIVSEPAPHVFQNELGDYAVNYELRAHTNQPALMFDTLSELRANVLDAFNQDGVEIMTPSILAHRDASNLAIPEEQFRERPRPAGISVAIRTDAGVAGSA